jgi:probable addiction module antidote protein
MSMKKSVYFDDHDPEALMLALRDLAKENKGMASLAKNAGLNRESLYKTLSGKRMPKFDTLQKIIHALGFRFSIVPLKANS